MTLRRRIERLEHTDSEARRGDAVSHTRRRVVMLNGILQQGAGRDWADRGLDAVCHKDESVRDRLLAEHLAEADDFVAVALSDATELPPHLAATGLSLEAFRAYMADVTEAERVALERGRR